MAAGELVWEKTAQEFARAPEDRELVVKFPFRNGGAGAVTIAQVRSSCDCTTAELAKKQYQPGEEGEITAKFVFGARRGLQQKVITVITDDRKTARLELKCWINEPLQVAPSLVFWRIGEKPAPRQVTLTAGNNVRVTGVASSNPRIAVTLGAPQPGGKYAVDIRPLDTAQTESAEIFVQTDYPPEGPKAYSIHARIK